MCAKSRRIVPSALAIFLTLMAVGPCEIAFAQKKKGAKVEPPTREGLLKEVKPAEGFVASIFALPPDVSYPTCLCAAPNGDVYVGIDLNGSLGKKKGQGKIVRCIDKDNDGIADEFQDFCEVQHPRGLFYNRGKMIVLHPPFLTAYYDDDGDGKADRQETLLKGISTDATAQRGADHTTNGFRIGIDGWLYIAVGDFGFQKAEGKDGKTVQLYGGGVVRVRPDGTDLEVVSRGQRNIYDVAVSPTLDLFTRDNTNDGGGWDVRLSHVVPLAHYGYPSLFKNFPDEHIHPLNDFGGGSPCGSLYVNEPGFPDGYGDTLYTVEWGVSAVFRHPLTKKGAGYEKSSQKPLVNLQKPTDMDVDGSGRLYITSWRGGAFDFSHPYVGYVARLVPKNWKYVAFPDTANLDDKGLLGMIASPSGVARQTAQLEILRRGEKPEIVAGLEKTIASDLPVPVRVAALFTLKQLRGAAATDAIMASAQADDFREFAVRAAADRVGEAKAVPTAWLTQFLSDPNPRVRLQTLIALGRLGRADAAAGMLPLTSDADPVLRHIAVRSLSLLAPVDVCLASLDANKDAVGAVRVLQSLHDPKATNGLIERLEKAASAEQQQLLLPALCRLYFKEHNWDGKWWGTRPDTTGPYFKRVTWDETKKIGEHLQQAMKTADSTTLRLLLVELKKHKIDLPGVDIALLKVAAIDPAFRPQAIDLLLQGTTFPPEALDLLAKTALNTQEKVALRAKALRGLHKYSDQKGFLAAAVDGFASLTDKDLTIKEIASAWEDFTRDGKHAGQIERFAQLTSSKNAVERDIGWAVLVNLATGKLTPANPRQAAERKIDQAWASPEAVVPLLDVIAKTKTDQYAFQIRSLLKSDNPAILKAAQATFQALGLDKAESAGPRIVLKGKTYEAIVDEALKTSGDAKLGAVIFLKQGCIACHTVAPTEPLKGPYLGDIAARYKRPEMLESILKPSAKISQGFETTFFSLTNGRTVEGFIVRESGEEVELRTSAGVSLVLKKDDIDERARRPISVMPEALAENLTLNELAGLVAYLESLNTKK
jgi:putative heme-binding domain-containing protein